MFVLLVSVAACSDDDAGEASDDAAGIELDLDAAPDPATIVGEDRGTPPSNLVAEDLVVGDGDPATQGAQLTMQYVGVRWSDGGQFDSSWENGQPFRFTLGEGQVIPGWDRGVSGDGLDVDAMRVGGRRSLIIPPDLAYGDRGAASVIGPDETLVFVIDLIDVQPAP